MEMFYVLSVFLLLGALINSRQQKLFIVVSFIILFILAAFRDTNVGTDTLGYERIFLRIKAGGTAIQEIGWQALNKIVIYFNGGFEDLLIVSSLLILTPVFYVAKKYSVNPMLSIFLYYAFYLYLQSFNITRQSIAISIILCAYILLINKKNLFFVLLVLLAATFHTTALLCLPLIFVNRIPDKPIIYLVLMGLTMVMGWVLSDYIINRLANLLGYENYLKWDELDGSGGLYLIILNAFFVFVLFTAKNRGVLFKLFFVFIVMANLTVKVPYGYRLIFYFTIIQVLYLPYFINNNKLLKARPLIFLLIVLYAYLVFSRSAGKGGVIPYINTLF